MGIIIEGGTIKEGVIGGALIMKISIAVTTDVMGTTVANVGQSSTKVLSSRDLHRQMTTIVGILVAVRLLVVPPREVHILLLKRTGESAPRAGEPSL